MNRLLFLGTERPPWRCWGGAERPDPWKRERRELESFVLHVVGVSSIHSWGPYGKGADLRDKEYRSHPGPGL